MKYTEKPPIRNIPENTAWTIIGCFMIVFLITVTVAIGGNSLARNINAAQIKTDVAEAGCNYHESGEVICFQEEGE